MGTVSLVAGRGTQRKFLKFLTGRDNNPMTYSVENAICKEHRSITGEELKAVKTHKRVCQGIVVLGKWGKG